MSRAPSQRPPQYGGGRGYPNGYQNGRGSNGQVDGMTAAMEKTSMSSPTKAERKGLCIVDPTSGEEVKVENKHDGKMKRAANGKGNGKGDGRKPGPNRTSTIGGRAVTTIGGKTIPGGAPTYALYDPTSNDYEESPKPSPQASPMTQSPTKSQSTPQVPLSAMPTPYTADPTLPGGGAPGPVPYTADPRVPASAGSSQPAPAAPPASQPMAGFGGLGGFPMGGSESLPGAGIPASQPPAGQPAPQQAAAQQSPSPGFMTYQDHLTSQLQNGGTPSPYGMQQQAPPHHNPHQPDYLNGFGAPAGHMPYVGPPGQGPMGMPPPMHSQHMPPQQNGMHPQARGGPQVYPGGMQVPAGGMQQQQPQMYPSGGPAYGQPPPHHHQQPAQPQYDAPASTGYQSNQQSQNRSPVEPANGVGRPSGAPSTKTVPEPDLESLEPSKMSKTQLKNQKKHQRARERKAKELREQAEETVLAWRTSVLAAPLASMGFPRERCYAAVCACSDGKTGVDLERCVAWLLSDQLFKGKQADLDISSDIQKMDDCESSGFCRADVERAVLDHGGDVDGALRALRNGTFTVSA